MNKTGLPCEISKREPFFSNSDKVKNQMRQKSTKCAEELKIRQTADTFLHRVTAGCWNEGKGCGQMKPLKRLFAGMLAPHVKLGAAGPDGLIYYSGNNIIGWRNRSRIRLILIAMNIHWNETWRLLTPDLVRVLTSFLLSPSGILSCLTAALSLTNHWKKREQAAVWQARPHRIFYIITDADIDDMKNGE